MTVLERNQLAVDVAHAEAPNGVPVLKAYQDSLGIWTIGLGTNLQELTISAEQARAWLAQKLAEAESLAMALPWFDGLTGGRQRAIVELLYNLGRPRFFGFHRMIEALEHRDYGRAADELIASAWYRQVGPTRGDRLAGLLRHG